MKDVVVFSGRNALDFPMARQSVLRVPEVSLRLKEAQAVLDQMGYVNFDVQFFVGSDDSLFMRNIQWKSLASAVVQVGLYDRWLKRFQEPAFLLGTSNAKSALQVCARQITMAQLLESHLTKPTTDKDAVELMPVASQELVLTGIALEQFESYQKMIDNKSVNFQKMDWETHDFNALLVRLIEEHDVRRVVMVGPGHTVINQALLRTEYDEVQVLDSIELDPMLNWFWREIRPVGQVIGFH